METDYVELDTRWRGLIIDPHPDSEGSSALLILLANSVIDASPCVEHWHWDAGLRIRQQYHIG
ncbi:MAG TPA: hypothetical protein VFF59_00400 [Anaerolineae bacterium]|nr:hypothetical protein [Anaerolineae bacterium]